jgi:hypothetical protein
MAAFLRRKGQILWDVMVDTTYVYLMNFLALDRGTCSVPTTRQSTTCFMLCVNPISIGCIRRTWFAEFGLLKDAHVGNAKV